MDSGLDYHMAKALLEWQVELGATEAILDAPVDRFALDPAPAKPAPAAAASAAAPPAPVAEVDPVEEARKLAAAAPDLEALRVALSGFTHCDLRRGARNLVFADGVAGARVMIIGEAPGRDEDREGRPFVGRAGQLLDRMLAAIGLSRAPEQPSDGVYITNVLPWRPPQNRDPTPQEIAMMVPFMRRHVELAAPEIVVLMGNISCQAGLGQRGITRLRGHWTQAYGAPALPMFHPAYLLRKPHAKREAWADLLSLQARLRDGGQDG
ncbi:MAG: uracil-DNA glycosylase [Sediminimonas sp.]|uniref:uracil-DNA glycosylase n=1 Tax=Sediminimonas sp. TaxID=2823379 RepID=UPI0028706B74|nr:uracil-DNA glycosylase [Sediminimonas sp.]MDR9484535.1 uracil-DNA glycosylase [Sediminimonas sp.]